MQTRYSFTKRSSNSKTGPIPTVATTSNSCPSACPLKGSGCYAENHWQGIQWRKLDNNPDALTIDQLAEKIKALPNDQLWRMNTAGDLAWYPMGDAQVIDWGALLAVINANHGKRGFTYTHHDVTIKENRDSIKGANNQGFTVNLSANNPFHADELAEINIGPVVTLLPEDAPTVSYTPQGRAIVVCPAVTSDSVTCADCGLCAKVDRKSIIGFPLHGTGKGKAHKVIVMARA